MNQYETSLALARLYVTSNPRDERKFHEASFSRRGNIWDSVVGGGAAAAFQATDRQTNKETGGHRHCVNPPLLWPGL